MDMATTYIYTIPSEQILQRNCSGGVVSIQYCYQASNLGGGSIVIFNLLSLHREETGDIFRVDSSIPIRSDPTNDICTTGNSKWCCDNTLLSSNPLSIPSSEYTFGVVTFSGDVTPLAFHNSVGNYQVPRMDVAVGVPSVQSTITPGPSQQRSLLLLRFLIGTGII